MQYEVTKDISPFANKGKVWIAKGEKVTEISREGNISMVKYRNELYPVNINFLIEVKKDDPIKEPDPPAAEIKKEPAIVFKPIPGKIKLINSKQTTLF